MSGNIIPHAKLQMRYSFDNEYTPGQPEWPSAITPPDLSEYPEQQVIDSVMHWTKENPLDRNVLYNALGYVSSERLPEVLKDLFDVGGELTQASAVNAMKDQAFLEGVALRHTSPTVRMYAMTNITDPEILKRLKENSKDETVVRIASGKLDRIPKMPSGSGGAR